ncbi:MAG TPA: 2-amino-4-hydroxy-6-hydroxymethyldihydropteridine diphosphokinase [Pirellulales bacterium]
MHRALIGLGANLSDRQQTLAQAVQRLRRSAGSLLDESWWHETPPVGGPSGQPAFLNGAVTIATLLPPELLMSALQSIEHELGRQRAERWSARAIDLDLLLYDDLVLDSEHLTLPHPRMAFRRFVLEPAAEIAADMLHPTTGWTVGQLFKHLTTAAPYLAIAGPPGDETTRLARRLAEQSGSRLVLDPGSDEPNAAIVSRRADLLDRAAWPTDRWTISDFWFDQSLAEAAVQSDEQVRIEIETAWRNRHERVMPPKLLAVLEPGKSIVRAENRDRAFRAVGELARRPDQGPVVWLSSDRFDDAVAELLAAMEAMR